MLRLIFWAIIIYFGFRLIQHLFFPKKPNSEPTVRGNNQNNHLDLRDADIEDASFRDIEDDREKTRN